MVCRRLVKAALEADGARKLRNESFFSAPQLTRDPLGAHTHWLMSGIRLELGDEAPSHHCDCCGGETHAVHGFAYEDQEPHALYYAAWNTNHIDQGVTLVVSLGDFLDGSGPWSRRAVAMECRVADEEYRFSVIEPEQSPWSDATVIGEVLPRERALGHPDIAEFFHIAEHVVQDDPRVKSILDRQAGA